MSERGIEVHVLPATATIDEVLAVQPDGKLLIVGVGGRLALARATPDKYDEMATFDLEQDVARALPALANGRLVIRTGSGGGRIHALQVGE